MFFEENYILADFFNFPTTCIKLANCEKSNLTQTNFGEYHHLTNDVQSVLGEPKF